MDEVSVPPRDSTPAASPFEGVDPRTLAIVGAVMAAALASGLYYALDLAIAHIRNGPPNPLSMTTSARIDYFWRIALSAFIGSVVGMLYLRVAGGNEARALRWTLRALWPVVLVASLLVAIWH